MGTNKFSRQSPELKRQRFAWLDQVLIDRDLPASAFKVAYRIGDGFNDVQHDGKAWESCKEIGNAIAMSEKTVITMVRRLHARGHLRVEWGQQGRGHPNNYWMIIKPQSAKVLKPAPAQVFDEIKPASGKIKPASTPRKPAPAQESHSISQGKGSHAVSANPPISSQTAQQQPMGAGVVMGGSGERDAAFEAFWSVYPKQTARREAEREFKKALAAGTPAEEIIAGAQRYAADPTRIKQSQESDRFTKNPNNWLREERWVDRLGGPFTIDQDGKVVQPPQPQEDDDWLASVANRYPNGGWQ